MSKNKLIILDEFGRVPTDSSTKQILNSVAKETGKDGYFNTLSGKKYNDPEKLSSEIDRRTVVVSINGKQIRCIVGTRNLMKFKKALREKPLKTSWQIVENR